MVLVLALTGLVHAHGPAPVQVPGADGGAQRLAAPRVQARPMQRAFEDAAAEFGVPTPILLAIGYEASHWSPDAQSRWGGWGMFDLREGDQDPSLEHAARLLEANPNVVARDWRTSIRGAAAILADQARASNGGRLPARDDLAAWWDAVRAFSGRHEPLLQDLYAQTLYEILAHGATLDTPWGRVTLEPRAVDVSARLRDMAPPPPEASDSPLSDQFVAACTDNYSNDSRNASDIDMVVIHTVQGGYSSCYNWFANCDAGASAHYVVRSSDGAVTQMVREADIAWHAGNWDYNARSVGIEHEGYVSDPGRWYTDAMYEGSAALVADIAARQGVPLDRSHVIGHDEVPDPYEPGRYGGAGNHTDPGGGWDWDTFMFYVNGATGTVGGEIVGVVADTDIYNGARLIGATVRIVETGATTTVGSDGMYHFEDVPFGSYTMRASFDGYADGDCLKTTASAQDWCSIALLPSDGGGDPADTGTDTTDTGGDTAVDSGSPPVVEIGDSPALPGRVARIDDEGGGCASVGSAGRTGGRGTSVLLGALVSGWALARGRRRT